MKWYTIEGPSCCGETSATGFLDRTFRELGVNARKVSDATRAGLRRLAREGVTPIVDDIDRKHAFRRLLAREWGDPDAVVIASATSVPSDLTQYETLWDMPGPTIWPI